MAIKQYEEPSLVHLEKWLHKRVLARKEANLQPAKRKDAQENFTGAVQEGSACQLCGEAHSFWKCKKYKDLTDAKKWEYVKKLRRCFNCFQEGHASQSCPSKNSCFKPGCSERHHTTLHDYFMGRGGSRKAAKNKKDGKKDGMKQDSKDSGKNASSATTAEEVPSEEVEKETTNMNTADTQVDEEFSGATRGQRDVYLQIVPVKLHGRGRTLDTYALLDGGSQSTLIKEDAAKELRLIGSEKMINLGTVNGSLPVNVREVTLKVSARDGRNEMNIASALVRPSSHFNMPSRPTFKDKTDAYKHLDINIDAVAPHEIKILIGANVPEALIIRDSRPGLTNQPLAVQTPFGWTFFGPSLPKPFPRAVDSPSINLALERLWEEEENSPSVHIQLVLSESEQSLHQAVERFWLQEHIGILPEREVALSQEDRDAMVTLERDTIKLDKRYQVPMLWGKKKHTLPDNIQLAKKRFSLLERRLRRDSSMFHNIKTVIDGYLKENPPHARKMTPEEAQRRSPQTWYLPIHPVVHPNKPGKVRVVNDAAAVYHNESLNSNLLTGPDLLNSLVGVLLRFRVGAVAIAADVKDMFHQVRVGPTDADALRFLWKDDIFSDGPPETYQMLVHIFGAKDSPACANYTLKRIARDNYQDYPAETFETVIKNFYVDDLLKSLHSVDAATKLANDLLSMLEHGGFKLTKFLSNCREVLEALPPSDVSTSATLELDAEHLERALGIMWDTVRDIFTFVAKVKENDPTKLGILSTSSSLFDPLGFLAPFLLIARILIQDLWRLGYEWDQIIDGKLRSLWDKWLNGVKLVPEIRISRRYLNSSETIQNTQLHVFCDASEAAYGCVAYLRFTLKSQTHTCSFVMSKARLAPIKAITLPRLELNAARAGARMARLIVHEIDLPIDQIIFWSDSMIVLMYIRNRKKRFKVFVANRVAEILELSEWHQWRYISGSCNPADVLSRGVIDPRKLMKGNWFSAPKFLYADEDTWDKTEVSELADDDKEIRQKSIYVAVVSAIKSELVDVKRFSDWLRLKRVTGWILRFAHNLLKENGKRSNEKDLQLHELTAAEHVLIRDAQRTSFPGEMETLAEGRELSDTNNLSSLSPILDKEGILRVGGRLRYVPIPAEAQHPAILSRDHSITRLIISWLHKKNGHVGKEHVLSLLLEKYWLMSARTAIKTVLRLCFFCQVRRAKRLIPKMADLPTGRAAINEPPYCQCGVDCIGPVIVKEGRKRVKRWIVLFTCLTVRCIHLEIVETAETDAFINSMRRFTNRRGSPSTMYSDRGSNFRGASEELKEFISNLDQTAINSFATSLEIKWQFNPPKSPHMGGVWERMVRSVKEVMHGILKDHTLTDPQLYTVLTEVENIVNSRPLTHVSNDVSDLEPLTPNHLLLGKHRNWSATIDTSTQDVFSRRKWKQVQGIRSLFWQRWTKEYLPTLTRRSRWRKGNPNFNAGELVLLKDDDFSKRGRWPLARITRVLPGRDGVVRVVELKTKVGVYTRSVANLFKLEDNLLHDVRQGGEFVTDGTE